MTIIPFAKGDRGERWVRFWDAFIRYTLGATVALLIMISAAILYQNYRTNQLVTQQRATQVTDSTILKSIAKGQKNHFDTIRNIQALALELKGDEKAQLSGNQTVQQILTEAGMAVKQLETQEAEICAAVNCTATHP